MYGAITMCIVDKKEKGRDTPVEEIFGDNLPRLRELKAKYDPRNIFKKWHNLDQHFYSPPGRLSNLGVHRPDNANRGSKPFEA